MAKKSFKENPALTSISQALAKQEAPGRGAAPLTGPVSMDAHPGRHAPAGTLTHADKEAEVSLSAQDLFAGSARESKSRRLQLLLRPSTHGGLTRLAKQYQTSVNDIINRILEEFLKRN